MYKTIFLESKRVLNKYTNCTNVEINISHAMFGSAHLKCETPFPKRTGSRKTYRSTSTDFLALKTICTLVDSVSSLVKLTVHFYSLFY